jgi:glycosyltransferase involved in cell wall biosynthesis
MLVENNYPRDTRVRNEASALAAAGFQVTVIALGAPGERRRELVDGVTVYRVPRLTLFAKLPRDKPVSVFRSLVNRLQVVAGYFAEYVYFTLACLALSLYASLREGFDVVHAHNPPDTLVIVGAVHKLLGKKFVFDHHDLSPELYRSRYRGDGGLIASALQFFETMSVRLADVVIATNESYRAIDIERSRIAPDTVFVVRNGPDLARVRLVPADQALRSRGRAILGYVGAMNPQDGVDYLLRALASLVHDLGRTDFYCVLIGDGDSLPALRTQASELGLDDHVWFTGFVPDDDMVRYLSSSDICLDPNPSSPLNDVSTWIKVMEYMALGKPVVSFALKETRVSAGDAAAYVPPNDERAFARTIAELMDDPDRCRVMGEHGIRRIQQQLGWHVTSRNLLLAYARLIPGASGARRSPATAA